MFDIGFAELLLLCVISMVVIGPEKLPGVARTVGKTIGKVRRMMTGFQNQIEQEIKLDELNKKIMSETEGMDFGSTHTIHSPSKPTDAEAESDTPEAAQTPDSPDTSSTEKPQ